MKVALAKRTEVAAEGNLESFKVITGGLSTSKENQKVLNHILISGIAENKMAYGIREIAANAWDANRKKAFDVHLPTQDESWFSIRDYGPGIPAEKYQNYVTLGDSSKRNNNNVVGCFGLGAKSPYAYLLSSDQQPEYTVTSIHKGLKQQYLHALNEDNAPTASLLFEEPTDEASGVEVSWPVHPHDVRLFNREAQDILGMFPAPHGLPGLEVETIIPGVHRFGFGQGKVFVRMGCVAYETNYNSFGPYSMILDTPLGLMSITASREALALDDPTKAALTELIASAKQKIIDHFSKIALSEKTKREGILRVPDDYRRHMPEELKNPPGFKYLAPNYAQVGFLLEKTPRKKDRQAEAGVSQVFTGSTDDWETLTSFGYEVVDLTKIKLPPRPGRVASKKNERAAITPGGGSLQNVFIKPDEPFVYVVMKRTGRRSHRMATDRYGDYTASLAEVQKLFPVLPGLTQVAIMWSPQDPLIPSGTSLTQYIQTNGVSLPPATYVFWGMKFDESERATIRRKTTHTPLAQQEIERVLDIIKAAETKSDSREATLVDTILGQKSVAFQWPAWSFNFPVSPKNLLGSLKDNYNSDPRDPIVLKVMNDQLQAISDESARNTQG